MTWLGGRVVAAFSVAGPATRFTPDRILEIAPLVCERSREISFRLGSRAGAHAASSGAEWPFNSNEKNDDEWGLGQSLCAGHRRGLRTQPGRQRRKYAPCGGCCPHPVEPRNAGAVRTAPARQVWVDAPIRGASYWPSAPLRASSDSYTTLRPVLVSRARMKSRVAPRGR